MDWGALGRTEPGHIPGLGSFKTPRATPPQAHQVGFAVAEGSNTVQGAWGPCPFAAAEGVRPEGGHHLLLGCRGPGGEWPGGRPVRQWPTLEGVWQAHGGDERTSSRSALPNWSWTLYNCDAKKLNETNDAQSTMCILWGVPVLLRCPKPCFFANLGNNSKNMALLAETKQK